MTVQEMIKILQTLPPEQRVGFEIEKYELRNHKKCIDYNIEEEQGVLLDINGYERTDIGNKDDEMFWFKLEICDI